MEDRPAEDPRFKAFVMLQAQNAGMFLGRIPNPSTGVATLNLRAAASVMDSLEMLASKTRGNLADSESQLLDTVMRNLKPLYEAALAADDA